MAIAAAMWKDASKKYRAQLEEDFCVVAPVKNTVSLISYLRFARQLQSQAKIYYKAEDVDQAYIFYKKYLKLVLVELPKHVHSAERSNEAVIRSLRDEAKSQLNVLQIIVDKLDRREYAVSMRQCDSKDASLDQFLSNEFDDDNEIAEVKQDTKQQATELTIDMLNLLRLPCDLKSNDSEVKPIAEKKENRRNLNQMVLYQHPESHLITRIAYNPSSHKLRPLVIPSSVSVIFERISARNSNLAPNGIETCGILAGEISSNHTIIIKLLVIPKQRGESDSVSMTHEEDLYNYMLSFHPDKIICGWIHTHPSQSCFLSSVDIHTHLGYQIMLPEAVAIVISPTDRLKRMGVFRLTEPDGLEMIQNCNARGFHPHETSLHADQQANQFDLYFDALTLKDSLNTGVNWVNDDHQLQVVDMRC